MKSSQWQIHTPRAPNSPRRTDKADLLAWKVPCAPELGMTSLYPSNYTLLLHVIEHFWLYFGQLAIIILYTVFFISEGKNNDTETLHENNTATEDIL